MSSTARRDPVRATYLDAASAEPLHPAARGGARRPPSTRGTPTRAGCTRPAATARLLLDNARAAVAEALGVRPDEVTFTGSGTEAVHLGLLGLHRGAGAGSARIVPRPRSSTPPSCTRPTWSRSPGRGRSPSTAGPGRPGGAVATVAGAAERSSVVALQAANHEVGTVQPVAEVAAALGRRPALHRRLRRRRAGSRCPRAGRRRPRRPTSGAVRPGVGVLLVRKGARWRNPFPGDDRVDERATGFENVPAALAAAAALQAVVAERDEVERPPARAGRPDPRRVAAEVPDVEVVGDPVDRLPHLVTFSCLYVDGEALVTELDRRGFGVASGSACTASTLDAQPRAGGDGRAHPRQRAGVAAPATPPRPTWTRFLAVLPDGRGRAARARWACDGAGPRARLPRPDAARCRSSSWPGASATSRSASSSRWSPTDAAAAVDVPAWCRMRGQEYVGEDAGRPTARRATWCGGSAERRLRSRRCGATSAAAVVAVRRAPAGPRNCAGGEGVLLGADRLHDVRREHAADLGGALVARGPRPARPGSRRGRRRRRRSARPPRRPARPDARSAPRLAAWIRTPSAPSVVTWVPTRSSTSSADQPVLLLDQCDSYSLENRSVAPSIRSRIRSPSLNASCWLGSAMNG